MRFIHCLWLAALAIPLAGCATGQVSYNDPDHSRAYNLAQSAGIRSVVDYSIAEGASNSGLTAATLSRDTVLAWIPRKEGVSKLDVAMSVANALYNASADVLDERGYTYRLDYKSGNKDVAYQHSHAGRLEFSRDGGYCDVRFNVYWSVVQDLAPLPEVTGVEGQGYGLNAGSDYYYPGLEVYCDQDDPDFTLNMMADISAKLPPTIYLYAKPRVSRDGKRATPAMVFDHGEKELFLKP